MGIPPVEIIPVTGIGEIRAGTDLPSVLLPRLREHGLREGDVICVSTKIVSKALGLVVAPSAKDDAAQEAAVHTVARRAHRTRITHVVQSEHGAVLAAAGIDASNSPEGLLLLPPNPDECAAHLHAEIAAATGLQIGVILTDTSSRVWRIGVSDIALGASGVAALQDLRGDADAHGRAMTVTVRALADEIASAADLVKGKTSAIPVAIVRGVPGAVTTDSASTVPGKALNRSDASDWFRRPSLESVWQALGLSLAQEPVAQMEPEPALERLRRAIAVACTAPAADHRSDYAAQVHLDTSSVPYRVSVVQVASSPDAWINGGALAERIRTAIRAEAIADAHPDLTSVEVTVNPNPPASTDAHALLAALEATGAEPVLSWYGEAARIELSGHVLANWIIKAIGHLSGELSVEPAEVMVVDMPPHWKRWVLAVAGWALGMQVRIAPSPTEVADTGDVAVLVTDRLDHAWAQNARDVLVVQPISLTPGAGHMPDPFHHDWVREVRAALDELQVALPAWSGPALAPASQRDCVLAPGDGLSDDPDEMSRILSVLLGGGRIVAPAEQVSAEDARAEGVS